MQKEWKKRFQGNCFCIFDYDYKKEATRKNWVVKGTENAGEFRQLCKAERMQIFSTMSENKAAFAERTIRSLKNILYRYMENNGYKYIQEMTQIVTTPNSR